MSVAPTAEQLEPFFFGSPGRRLFGCYHEPQGWPAREQGVLLCYPFGQEYLRSHRAFQRLAVRIGRAGFPALRFDYFGTGDSQGADEEADLDQWRADLRLAVAELRARSGVERVILAGLRLGASLALSVATQTPELAGLVLWEPIVNGRRYLDELRARHDELIMRFFTMPKDYTPGPRPAELLGFALSERMYAAIEAVDLLQAPVPRSRPLLLIESHATDELSALSERLDGLAHMTHQHVPSFAVWTEDVDKGLVPQQVIEAIVAWLDGEFA